MSNLNIYQSTSLVLSDDLTINSNTTLRSQITNFLNEEEEKLKEEESIMETLAEFQNSNNEQKMENNEENDHKNDEKINENVTEEESDLKSMKENSLPKNESSTTLISRCSESQSRPDISELKTEILEKEAYDEMVKTLDASTERPDSTESQEKYSNEEVIDRPISNLCTKNQLFVHRKKKCYNIANRY